MDKTFKKVCSKSISTKQANFNEALVDYVALSLKPYTTVEDVRFKTLVKTLDPSIKVMGRKVLMGKITNKSDLDQQKSTSLFADAKYVGTAADIWSCSRHGYMGMVATTITPSFQRVTRAIACKHFENPHSGSRIAELIADVHEDKNLGLEKLTGCAIDNGANIVKAFNIGEVDSSFKNLLAELDHLVDTLPKHNR